VPCAATANTASLPANYDFQLRARVTQAREGEAQYAGLKKLLDQTDPSDLELAGEWDKLVQKFPTQAALVHKEWQERCKLAVRRRRALQAIDLVITETGLDPHQRDHRLASVWATAKDTVDGSADMAGTRQNRVNVALFRVKALERLERAIREQDVSTIREVSAPRQLPNFASYPPVVALRPQIDELVKLATWLDDLRAKLTDSGRTTGLPLTADDLTKLRQYGEKLDAGTRAAVKKCLDQRLWPAVKLTAAAGAPQVKPGAIRMAKVRWSWTGPDLVSWFDIAVAPGPLADVSAAKRERLSRCRPQDHAGDGGGRWVALGQDRTATVTIWPVLDLGWATLHGPPIHIGPIRG
jgi:hypothetical protein